MAKEKHTSFRYGEETEQYLSSLQDDLGVDNRSEVIRIIIKAFNGLIFGNFLALLDKDALKEEWGEIGKLLALMKEDPPESIDRARLGDVIKSLPYLVSAAKVELEDINLKDEE